MTLDLDIDSIIQELSLPKQVSDDIVKGCVDAVTDEVWRNWRLEASNGLNKTRQDYLNGMNVINNSDFSKTIQLSGAFNVMLEEGKPPFDMKPGFKNSKKVKYSTKVGKNGKVTMHWYLTIPFRHGVPTTIGENPAFSNIQPDSIYDIMKQRPAGMGLKKSEIPAPYDVRKTRAAIPIPSKNVNIPPYRHKSSIYEGLTKITAGYGKTTQNYYMSFRRVSENSDPNSWIHKGIRAGNFLKKGLQQTDVETICENKVDEILFHYGY